jgi:hypothetical protein
MPANLEDVREWMAEGDRLMAQGYDYLQGGADDPLQMDLAGRHFSRAAQAYLAGGVEYQLGPDNPVQAGSAIDDPAALIPRLDGHLRHEADAAAKAAGGHAPAPGDARRAVAERSRAFAEDLRERFEHAAPDLFTRPAESGFERPAIAVRGR